MLLGFQATRKLESYVPTIFQATVDGTYFASDYGKRRGMIRDWFESCFPSTPIPPYPHFKVESKISFGTGEINSTDYPAEGAGQNIRQH